MSAFGFILIAFGVLTAWSGFKRINVLDVLRSFLGGGAAKTSAKATGQTPGTLA